MSKGRKTAIRYGITGVGVLLRPSAWLMEQWFSTREWWPDVPWGLISGAFIFFLLGQLVADWTNETSWLRERWARYRRLFDAKILSGFNIEITAARDLVNASALLHVHDVLDGRSRRIHDFTVFAGKTLLRGHSEKIPVATIPKQSPPTKESGNAFWLDHAATLLEGSENIVGLEIRVGRRSQTHLFYLRMFQPGAGTGGRYYLVDETHPAIDLRMPDDGPR